ncbi:GNAT family N-acetyltransferase [Acidithiobacillus montserratensis]|uniref:GNAT family N-acetyltransferase n=1 Tax=Acidithiobacillus montserratensis TaxID=2729135 RepID=A0ACD5HFP3_9PROT|nr:GNAT family N-acetyltransferase [Acidithiobacillus montserratensis]
MESGKLPAEVLIRLLGHQDLPIILPLVQLLNPTVSPEQLAQRLQEMTGQGYECAAVFMEDNCVGVAGIWLGTRFWCGRYLDVDNVVVDPAYRDCGIGQQLMNWVENYARHQRCEIMVLDAYVTNQAARRFYERNGYQIVGHHFVKTL